MTSPVRTWPVLARVNFPPINLELWIENVSYFFKLFKYLFFAHISQSTLLDEPEKIAV